jgi:hypothetical protein
VVKVNMMTRVCGASLRISRVAATPSRTGIDTSIVTTSGAWRSTIVTAERPLAAVPTSSRSSAESMHR